MWHGFRMKRLVWSRLAGFRQSVFNLSKSKKAHALPEVTR